MKYKNVLTSSLYDNYMKLDLQSEIDGYIFNDIKSHETQCMLLRFHWNNPCAREKNQGT